MAPDSAQIPTMQPSYPAITKQAAGMIDGILTDVTTTTFSDKIMITIIQDGRLAQWVLLRNSCVPASSVNQHSRSTYLSTHPTPVSQTSTYHLATTATPFYPWPTSHRRHCLEDPHRSERLWVSCTLHKLPVPLSRGTPKKREQ